MRTWFKLLFDVKSHLKFGKAWQLPLSSQRFSTKAFCYLPPHPKSIQGFIFLHGLKDLEISVFDCVWNITSRLWDEDFGFVSSVDVPWQLDLEIFII